MTDCEGILAEILECLGKISVLESIPTEFGSNKEELEAKIDQALVEADEDCRYGYIEGARDHWNDAAILQEALDALLELEEEIANNQAELDAWYNLLGDLRAEFCANGCERELGR